VTAERSTARGTTVSRAIRRLPGGDMMLMPPRVVRFLRSDRRTGLPTEAGVEPSPRPNPMALAASVAIDEMVLVYMRQRRVEATADDLVRIGEELSDAAAAFRDAGWADDPTSFHSSPSAPHDVRLRPGRARGGEFERLSFDSGYDPDPRIPGADRWTAKEANRRARAFVVRGRPGAPWVVALHGFSMGGPRDMQFFGSQRLRAHGVNVIHPVLPLHGSRRSGRRSGDGVISLDVLANVHAVSQALWDVRRCILWAREQGATRIGLHGISLGGYIAALAAGVVDGIDCAVVGIPAVDMGIVMRQITPSRSVPLAERAGLFGPDAADVLTVVSPLAFAPLVPHAGRFVYAGVGDRVATPQQAELLWHHWDRPRALWFSGGHVAWPRDVRRFTRRAIYSGLLGQDAAR